MVRFREDRWDLGLRGLRVGSVEERGGEVRVAVAAPPFVLELSKDCLLSKGTPRAPGAAPLALRDAADVLRTLVGTKVLVSVAFPSGHLRLVFGDGRHITAPGRYDPDGGPADWALESPDGVLIRSVGGEVESTGGAG
ncbi:hypothetical protein O4J56_16775 [Nocardiopsis sp. RSe5-2]|uniref:Uncharacterized protein n=1 Tax=Nocardiopsis endophytica TaxID=3018445 RepID=A0ABT4U5R2_9ACTN|nr:hypothetical protein [Nocardiopsis endophytica]MDA2812298.1 hypothetical protein [Nocardiopsis endophytica]